MALKAYADTSPRFAVQLGVDVLFVVWVIGWIWAGVQVHDGVVALQEPGERLEASASDLAGSLGDAGAFLGRVPLVGEGVREPFDAASEASGAISQAGGDTSGAVERLAFWLGLLVAVLPTVYLAPKYVPSRVRWIREAGAGRRVLAGPADLEVFAWRALVNQPLHRLAEVSEDPVGGLRRGDPEVTTGLAGLELERLGIAAPQPPRSPAGA